MRFAAAIATVAWLACAPAGDHPPVYPVKGKVMYKGKPITEGTVIYELEGGGEAKGSPPEPGAGPLRVTGRIQADGTFRLWAFPGVEGMPEGHYKVGVTSRRGRTEVGDPGRRAEDQEGQSGCPPGAVLRSQDVGTQGRGGEGSGQ